MASERDESREQGATSQCEDGEKDGNNAGVDDAVASPEMLIKHPLQNRWSLWFFKNDKNRDWTENQRCITSFDTVEDFWGLYNHVQKASKLPPGCDYSMFKEGIQPAWEDSRNKNGGRWLISLNKQQRHTDLDNFWLETLLCLIGEAFDEQSDDVCGAVVNIRGKGDKLALWTVDANRAESNTKIGKKLKERLNIPAKFPIGFQAHQDTISKTGSTAKNRFTV
ncbi:eukaryotic translation initiation factor 4E-like isoform X1 [Haliotis asinina]|uniref:eukaryotic translation initiation factor 4E-like isoform X1 n=1 Tax=Haliotis asinina TaxID=109174 RepID=UPI00353213DC